MGGLCLIADGVVESNTFDACSTTAVFLQGKIRFESNRVTGPAGRAVYWGVSVSLLSQPLALAGIEGLLSLATPVSVVPVGQIPASGSLSSTFALTLHAGLALPTQALVGPTLTRVEFLRG